MQIPMSGLPSWVDDPCNPAATWKGITCSGGFVTGVSYIGSKLSGVVPTSLRALTNLTIVTLNGDGLLGTLPVEWSELTKLQTMAEWSELASLQTIVSEEEGERGNEGAAKSNCEVKVKVFHGLGIGYIVSASVPPNEAKIAGCNAARTMNANKLIGSIPVEWSYSMVNVKELGFGLGNVAWTAGI
eukprot:gene6324-2948_t